MKPLLLAFLVAAFAITAAYQDTMSTNSPEDADEVEVVSSLSSKIEIPVARERLLPANKKTGSSTLEKEQARLDDFVDAVVEQQARPEDPVQDRSTDPTSLGRRFSYLAYYVFSEIPPDEKPADTFLETIKDLPVGTPIEEIKRAFDVLGLDFSFMK